MSGATTDDPRLTAYALGELDGPDKDAVEELLARSPDASLALADIRRTADLVAEAFGGAPALALRSEQRRELEAALPAERAVVVAFRSRRRLWAGGIALAAAAGLVGIVVARWPAEPAATPGDVAYHRAAEGRATYGRRTDGRSTEARASSSPGAEPGMAASGEPAGAASSAGAARVSPDRSALEQRAPGPIHSRREKEPEAAAADGLANPDPRPDSARESPGRSELEQQAPHPAKPSQPGALAGGEAAGSSGVALETGSSGAEPARPALGERTPYPAAGRRAEGLLGNDGGGRTVPDAEPSGMAGGTGPSPEDVPATPLPARPGARYDKNGATWGEKDEEAGPGDASGPVPVGAAASQPKPSGGRGTDGVEGAEAEPRGAAVVTSTPYGPRPRGARSRGAEEDGGTTPGEAREKSPLSDRSSSSGGPTVAGASRPQTDGVLARRGLGTIGGQAARGNLGRLGVARPARPVFYAPFQDPRVQPLTTFGVDVDTASYTNVRRHLRKRRLPPPDAVRIEELVNYFAYGYPEPKPGQAFSLSVDVAECPWAAGHQLVRIGLRGRSVPHAERPAANLVLLVDVSGSMRHRDKLPLLKEALQNLTHGLHEDDRLAIVTYAGRSGVALYPTAGSNKTEILRAIEGLRASGNTNGSAGLRTAYSLAQSHFVKGGVNRVILATDGDFNAGIRSKHELRQLIAGMAQGGVMLTVLGVGTGDFKDDVLEMLADRGNGTYAYLDDAEEAFRVLTEQLSGTLVTIARDVKVQVEVNPARVHRYRRIGYENRAMADRAFHDAGADAGEIGAGHTVTALYELVPPGEARAIRRAPGLRYAPRPEPAEEDGVHMDELLTVRVHYKEPDGRVALPIELPVRDGEARFEDAAADTRFAAAVAMLGMALRGDPYVGSSGWWRIEQIARDAAGSDSRRLDLLELVRLARRLQGG